MTLIDIISPLLISSLMAVILWPYLGAASLIAVLCALGRQIYVWMNADLIVAEKAGFRRPTVVQQRYLEYLGMGQEVFTHPSILPIAGILASSKRRLILLTAGLINELSENELRALVGKLAAIDRRPVFRWTFHFATGGISLFSRADKNDPFGQTWGDWARMVIKTGLVGGISALIMAVIIAAPISMVFDNSIDISPIIAVYWLPLVYFGGRFVWRWGNAALLKPAAGNWNTPATFEKATFTPMLMPLGSYPNLNLLRHGLLVAEKQPDESMGT